MKINYPDKEGEDPKAVIGDLIEFDDNTIGLVLDNGEVALLLNVVGRDFFMLAIKSKYDFQVGNYKIIARVKDWEINILK